MDIDHALESIGSLQRFQKIGALLMNLAFLGTVVLPNLELMFMAVEPPWVCAPGSLNCNLTGLYKPGDDLYNYRCNLNRSDWEYFSEYSTILTEWDLVCDDSLLWSVIVSAIFLGTMVGGIVFGAISDKYGRKKILNVTYISIFILKLVSSFIPWFWVFAVFRLFIGFFVGGSMITSYVFIVEFTGVRHRNYVAHLVGGLPWTYGRCVLALAAYLITSWRHLNTALSLLIIPGLLSLWYFPETPHWLLLEDKQDEAQKCMRRIARVNGRTMPEVYLVLPVQKSQQSSNGKTRDLFRTWSSTMFTLSMFIVWLSLSMQSYGGVFVSVTLGGNMFLNVAIIGLIILPAPIICIWFTSKFGRRDVIVSTLVLSSLCCGAYLAVLNGESDGMVGARVTLFVLISWFNEFTWDAVYLITAEYFPTMTRNIAVGWCSAMARLGAFSSSYVIMLGNEVNPYLPLAIFGICTLLSAGLTILVRDTRDDATPETVEEMDLEVKRKFLYDVESAENPLSVALCETSDRDTCL